MGGQGRRKERISHGGVGAGVSLGRRRASGRLCMRGTVGWAREGEMHPGQGGRRHGLSE